MEKHILNKMISIRREYVLIKFTHLLRHQLFPYFLKILLDLFIYKHV